MEIYRQIMAALSYDHGHSIVPRDLKPDSIFLDRNRKVKIMDYVLRTQVEQGQMMNKHNGP